LLLLLLRLLHDILPLGHEPALWLLLLRGHHLLRGIRLRLVGIVDLLLHLRLLLDHGLQGVHVVRILHVIFNDVVIETAIAIPLNPVLSIEQADATVRLLLELLQERFLLLGPEVVLFLRHPAAHAAGLGELLLELTALSLVSRVGHDALVPEEVQHLAWHLFKSLLGQHHRVVLEVPEGHELDDIGTHLLAVSLGVERLFIRIELIHGAEIS